MHYTTKLILLLICFNIYNLKAQNINKHAAAIQQVNVNPDQINVDQLSDADIAKIQEQLQANGLSYDQLGQLAALKGMSQTDIEKLKTRLTQAKSINTNQKKAAVQPEKEIEKSDYKVYQKSTVSTVFGSSLFNTPSLSFEPNLRIATPVNYILGPDDELSINVSGYQETNIQVPIQPEGAIFIPQVGSINVMGLSIEEAKTQIRNKMAQTAYPSLKSGLSKIIISLNKIRSIRITVIGATKPGNYTVSSLATVFNSLYLCGGPGEINTYRDIELIRNNKIYQKIDIYQFLTKGDQKGNIPLQENDVINFPVYKKHVSINGAVKRGGIFELRDGETLENLLFFAGGYADKAYKAIIKVKQVTDTERKIKDIPKAEISNYQPSNGDEFQVDSVLNQFENGVAINGAVYRPGEFELTPGITISGLIKRAGGLQGNVFTDRAILSRTYPNGIKENITFNVTKVMDGGSADISLIKRDTITIAFADEYRSDYKVQIQGEVRKPGVYPFKENLSLKDILFIAGGFTDAASTYHIEIGRRIINERTDKNIDSIAKVFDIDSEKGLSIENNKFILLPYDIITVYRNPGYSVQERINITGEVNFEGTYTIKSKTERISDLIKRAGGLTSQAYLGGVFLIRKDHIFNNIKQESVKTIQNSIKDTSSKVIKDVIRNNVKIAVDIRKVLDNPGSVEDFIMQDGDSLRVSKISPLVKISGEVLLSTQTSFVKGEPMDYYLSRAGGVSDNARRSKIYVIHTNGHISRTKNGIWGIFRSYPKIETGSEIFVPRKIEKPALSLPETIGITSSLVALMSVVIITISSLKK